jgi:CubicO group peptidase (beta-lactamase class C family)
MSCLTPVRRVLPLLLASTAACAHLARPERVYLDRVVAPGPLPTTLDATMRQFAREGFSGAVLIAERGRVLLYKGYGDANRARHLPNTAETKYPFGALANQFTAAAILALEADGRLRLDQPAAQWIGPDAGNATIADLLTRSSEVPAAPAVRAASFSAGGATPAVEQFLSPGPSYELLERVVRAATGQPMGVLLHDRLFQPSSVDRTVFDDGFLNDSLVARGYTAPYGGTIVVTGLVGPLADLYHWHQALHLGKVLPAAARQRMFTPAGNGYGLGLVVGRTAEGERLIEHASDQAGFQLWYGYFPEREALILLASNTDEGFRQPVAERLTTLLTAGEMSAGSRSTKDDRAGGR